MKPDHALRTPPAGRPGRNGLRPRDAIFDLYGLYIRRLGGWIAIADLVRLLGDLGIDETSTRSAVSRLTRRDLLKRDRERRVGYRLTQTAEAILAEGDKRIFDMRGPPGLHEGWTIVSFSIEEARRNKRHALRSGLARLGFARAGVGLWIAPWRLASVAREVVIRLGEERNVDVFHAHYDGFGDLEELVTRCWDIEAIRLEYVAFLEDAEPLLSYWGQATDSDARRAFVHYTNAVDKWRRLSYLDAGLPAELLPIGWDGSLAKQSFLRLQEYLSAAAMAYVAETMQAKPAPAGAATAPASSLRCYCP